MVAYGGGVHVAVYDPEAVRVRALLRGHRGEVTCAHWLGGGGGEILSGCARGDVLWWRYEGGEAAAGPETLPAPPSEGAAVSVSAVRSARLEGGATVAVAARSDGSVRVWLRAEGGAWALTQEMRFRPRQVMEAAAVAALPGTGQALLALAGLDCRVHLYAGGADGRFARLLELEGHEDWVRDLDFCLDDGGDLLLASASQDEHVRLWRVCFSDGSPLAVPGGELAGASDIMLSLAAQQRAALLEEAEEDDDDDDDDDDKNNGDNGGGGGNHLIHDDGNALPVAEVTSFGTRGHAARLGSTQFGVLLEALLVGHEGRVMTARWHPPTTSGGRRHQPQAVLTASADKCMMVWRPDPDSGGVWLNDVRVGTVGAHTYGLFGGCFGPGGRSVLSHAHSGAFRLWRCEDGGREWHPAPTVSGHAAAVTDLDWDASRRYLLTVSRDQTTRLFAPWPGSPGAQALAPAPWQELARPQVHGYDLSCVAALPGRQHCFASAADEKVVRVFLAPRPLLDTLRRVAGIATEEADDAGASRSAAAEVPELGLSNKGRSEEDAPGTRLSGITHGVPFDADADAAAAAASAAAGSADGPPLEEALARDTLWPETEKLYGHGHEVVSMCASRSGALVAAACSARQAEHAVVRLWDATTWREAAQLPAHTLTVVQMEFSPGDEHLLTVSRDRHLAVFDRCRDAPGGYRLAFRVKAHARIVWSCSWFADGAGFATASRDKKVRMWERGGGGGAEQPWEMAGEVAAGEAATAVACCPRRAADGSRLLCYGTEGGRLVLCAGAPGSRRWSVLARAPARLCHAAAVRRIRWREPPHGGLEIASCSEDGTVRITAVDV